MIIMISYVTLCRGFGCELKKVRKMRLGPTCQGLLSQEVAFQAKWEKDLFVLAAAETSQTWTFYTQRRLLTDTGLPQRLKAVLALKYTCLLLFWSSFPPARSETCLNTPEKANTCIWALRASTRLYEVHTQYAKQGYIQGSRVAPFVGHHELFAITI